MNVFGDWPQARATSIGVESTNRRRLQDGELNIHGKAAAEMMKQGNGSGISAEIPSSLERLSTANGLLEETISALETRLGSVLEEAQPRDGQSHVRVAQRSKLGALIEANADGVLTSVDRIRGIIERLAL